MRHPSEYYVRYLLAASWGDRDKPSSIESANETLTSLGLMAITESQWNRLLGVFQAPPDFLFNNARHGPTVAFMRQERIYTIWQPNEDMRRVLSEIFGDHGDRSYQHDIHILLMGDVPHKVIADKISQKYRLPTSLTEGMITVYEHYFWRRKSLTKVEWVDFLQLFPARDDYLSPLFSGEQQALFRAGLNPKYDYKQSLRDAHRQISFRIQTLAYKSDDYGNVKTLTTLCRELRSLYQILYGEGGGYEEQLKEIRHWIMEHRDEAIPAIMDLVGPDGSYSGDGSEPEKTKNKEREASDDGNADA